MFWKFVRLAVSRPLVTIRLLSFRRLANAISVLIFRPGNLGQLLQRYRSIYLSERMPTTSCSASPARYLGDIILFPPIDWHFRFQRPQHLALALATHGFRVIYVAQTPLIAGGPMPYAVQEAPGDGVLLVQLASGSRRLPDLYRDSAAASEIAGYKKSLRALIDDLGIRNPIALIQHPFWFPIAEGLEWSQLVYDCLDHHAGFLPEDTANLVSRERDLIASANVVVASSKVLADEIAKVRPCLLIRNGCDFKRFSELTKTTASPRPVIGYVGAIAEWFDINLLVAVARMAPHWDFVLVGSAVGSDFGLARNVDNIQFRGEVPYADVPAIVASFNVCLIPFKISPLTLATNPVKVYEYLAAGRPVVATALPELISLADRDVDVFTATGAGEFIDQIKRALACADAPDRIAVRQAWARDQDWSLRGRALVSSLLDEASGTQVQSAVC
jgi:glycosyltransferase involved in cell wall biosynthesis